MNDRHHQNIGRRDVLRVLTLTAGVAVAATAPLASAEAAPANDPKTGRARYQPNSADVQNYYRVNRYPQK
jgi:hypothetical protein